MAWAPRSAPPVAPVPMASPDPDDDFIRVGPRTFRRLFLRGMATDVTPRLDREGAVTGFELTQVDPRSVPDRLGLETGDVIVSIEGLAAGELEHPDEAFRSLNAREPFCMDVERDGDVTELCYRR